VPALAPIVDSNVHLWDGSRNPVFWLADRSLVRDLIGDYDSLPDVYTLRDYEAETASLGVRGIVWSDAGAADPVAAAEWVQRQDDGRGLVTGLVSLGDPASPDFVDLLDRLARVPLVHSVRVRLASGLAPDGGGSGSEVGFLDRGGVMRHFAVMADRGLVATIEATGEQLDAVARLADEVRELRIVVDHFGWPTDLSDAGRAVHRQRLTELAARPNVATRLDAIGTIFGSWTIEQVSPWLRSVVDVFGPDRCMLGSDLPIERLRSSFAGLYDAYGQIFADLPAEARADLFGRSAERWYGNG
jgi:predicted TIM-barrel fold metal-dependent hydrolase